MKKLMKRSIGLALALCLLLTAASGFALAEGYVKTSGKVNVRTGAGLDYDSLGTVPKDSQLTFLDRTATDSRGVVWYNVRYNSYTTGWVSSKYASLHDYTLKVTAVSGQTYIRDAANLDGKALDVLHKGESGTYLDQSSVDERGVAWYRISFEGIKGWVSSRYTKLGDASSSEPSRKVTAVGGQTNIRTSGNLDAKSLGVLHEGESGVYLNETTTDSRGVRCFRVSFDGIKGWVSSRYTKLEGDTSAPPVVREVVATGGKTNIRTSGNLSAESVGILREGERATYMGESSTDERGVVWYRIIHDGQKGWVSSRYTTLK